MYKLKRFSLDLAYQVQRRSQGCFTLFPLGRANFAGVSRHILGSLDLTQQLLRIATDTTGVDFNNLDLAFGVDHEGAAVSQASFFDHHIKVAGNQAGRITDHWVLDLANFGRAVVPRLVGEVGVGRNCIDLYTQLLELVVVVSQVTQLGGANKGEVGRVEEHD